jgi:hypothetical protein
MRNYRVGVVTMREHGLVGKQYEHARTELKRMATLQPNWLISVLALGRTPVGSGAGGALFTPPGVRNLATIADQFETVGVSDRAQVTELMNAVKDCDEVWIFPWMASKTGATRIAQLWRAGQQTPRHAQFKWIPPWVNTEPLTKAEIEAIKTGKKGHKL